jgi:hypothetical protein
MSYIRMKDGARIHYPGWDAPHRMGTHHKNRVNEDLLAFLKG